MRQVEELGKILGKTVTRKLKRKVITQCDEKRLLQIVWKKFAINHHPNSEKNCTAVGF